jgi:peptidoglycan hydrolase-like protein with peptidoglycan-binding domain
MKTKIAWTIILISAVSLPYFALANFTQNLVIGSSGEEVKQLQSFLAQDKDVYPEGLVTGYFGRITEQAVIRFQKKNGIEPVGKVGPKTREQLNKNNISLNNSNYLNNYVPQVLEVSTSTAVNSGYVFWTTNKNTRSVFWYSTNSPVDSLTASKIEDNSLSMSHSVNLTNLSTSTTYYYLIKIFDAKNNAATTTEAVLKTLN